MQRLAFLAIVAIVVASGPGAALAQTTTILGDTNQLLSDGSAALAEGRYEEGIRLSLAGLELPNNTADQAAALSNICAGYAALEQWSKALPHCNRSLELDRGNWRTFNNRAAVFVGLELYELALTDVNAGLAIAPNSATLRKSREAIEEHRQAAMRDRKRRPAKA
jgi:tetratricopeptide (TPR) repeat protein